MDDILVSINIPVFKCEKYILRCLESVKNQTYSNLEIILVNDCTPDDSIVIVEKFIQDNPNLNIKLLHLEQNSGLSVVRNIGIDASNGEYIFFLDSDDELLPLCIEKLVENVRCNKTQVVIAQNRWINTFDNTTKDFGFPTKSVKKIFRNNLEIFEEYSKGNFPSSSWNKLIKRDFVLDNKIYFVPGLYAQDELWFFHLLLIADSLSIIDDITYLYYLHGESVIFNRKKKNFENFMTILEHFNDAYQIEPKGQRKDLILSNIVRFKEMVLIMQWKSLKDKSYLQHNISRMQKLAQLHLKDYLSDAFSNGIKKKNFFQNIPASMATRLFIYRFER